MSKNPTLSEQIEALETAQKRVAEYDKLFDAACQNNFDMSAKSIAKLIRKMDDPCSSLEQRLITFFGLKTEKEQSDFIQHLCTEEARKRYLESRQKVPAEAGKRG